MTSRFLLSLTLATVLAGGMLAAEVQAAAGQVNINTATAEELQLLPRVGPALATRIVEFREANGRFSSVEELMRVRGVGERSFENLRPYLSVKGETTLTHKVKGSGRAAGGDG